MQPVPLKSEPLKYFICDSNLTANTETPTTDEATEKEAECNPKAEARD